MDGSQWPRSSVAVGVNQGGGNGTPHLALAKCPANVDADVNARASQRKSGSPGLQLELLFGTNLPTAGGKQPAARGFLGQFSLHRNRSQDAWSIQGLQGAGLQEVYLSFLLPPSSLSLLPSPRNYVTKHRTRASKRKRISQGEKQRSPGNDQEPVGSRPVQFPPVTRIQQLERLMALLGSLKSFPVHFVY